MLWLLVAFALGVVGGVAVTLRVRWVRDFLREFREQEAEIDRSRAELDARIKGGFRRTAGKI